MSDIPALRDVMEAQSIVRRYLPRTPLFHYPALDELLGAKVYIKHENHQPTGAFKVRGGINLLAHLSPEERQRGIITASTGNHGQSIAYACHIFGARAVIGMPSEANPLKVDAIRRWGAEVLFHGENFDEARRFCEEVAEERGMRYVHAVNEPLLIAGVATETLEIFQDLPDVDVIILPLGGGTGASGACIVAKAVNPAVRVVAVQSAQAPAAYLSWRERRIATAENHTLAEGLATGEGYELAQRILWGMLDDFVLVDDRELLRAVRLLIERAHTLAEPAGSASLAGALKVAPQLAGKKVVLVVSGANITAEQLQRALTLADS